MYVLQSLQGQFSGFHLLILLLETSKLGNSLQVIGTIFYIIGTRQNIISVLWDKALRRGLEDLEVCYSL